MRQGADQVPGPPAQPALPLCCTNTGVNLKAWLSDPDVSDAACEGSQEGSWGFGVNHPEACIGMEKTGQREGADVLLRAPYVQEPAEMVRCTGALSPSRPDQSQFC